MICGECMSGSLGVVLVSVDLGYPRGQTILKSHAADVARTNSHVGTLGLWGLAGNFGCGGDMRQSMRRLLQPLNLKP